ncbi:flagellar assembly protein T N-terminal domain-containing protein [Shewanella profunda]|uniref:flagella assembly protein FlgT middle domain-containing protein n=1 Tax=Shewanella profunda TaxID=254793 RepID=UPI00200F2277|nr:flagella assembly protein FlgT middle domain-containing protein [Shewanella profunda]MCL1090376.1 flagellar assembly protein T N-terminal domain-containing protein [Shewanella profunda]
MQASMRILLLALGLIAPLCHAQWYIGQATLSLGDEDYNKIRSETIKQAIENASLQASSFISIKNTVTNGILAESSSALLSENHIAEVVILNESVAQNALTINLKVNIQSQTNCIKDKYTKQIIIGQFPLLIPAQASDGGIYKLPDHISSRFKTKLTNQPSIFVETLLPQTIVDVDEPLDSIDIKHIEAISLSLSHRFQSQYLIFGYIRDVSLFEEKKTQLLQTKIKPMRNFTIKVFVYDRLSQSLLLQTEYHGEGGWSFDSNATVDLANSLFWRSDYGKVIVDTLYNAASDINDTLSCQPTRASILYKEDDLVTINLGTQHGVKLDDKFKLVKQRNLPTTNGMLNLLIPLSSPVILDVIHTSDNVSLLRVSPESNSQGKQQDQVDLFDVIMPFNP